MATPAKADCGPATREGYCGVVWGMTEAEAAAAFPGGLFDIDNMKADPDFVGCYYLQTAKDNYDAGFMVADGKVERLDMSGDWISTDKGARVGMLFSEVEALYPGAVREPNHYTAPLEDLIVDLGGGVKAVFEQSENGRITAWRIGRTPAVELIEGCS